MIRNLRNVRSSPNFTRCSHPTSSTCRCKLINPETHTNKNKCKSTKKNIAPNLQFVSKYQSSHSLSRWIYIMQKHMEKTHTHTLFKIWRTCNNFCRWSHFIIIHRRKITSAYTLRQNDDDTASSLHLFSSVNFCNFPKTHIEIFTKKILHPRLTQSIRSYLAAAVHLFLNWRNISFQQFICERSWCFNSLNTTMAKLNFASVIGERRWPNSFTSFDRQKFSPLFFFFRKKISTIGLLRNVAYQNMEPNLS